VDTTLLVIAGAVYAGMLLGEIPGLALDRTGVALLGAIALVATGRVAPSAAWDAVDISTIALLLGLMVVSAQFRLAGNLLIVGSIANIIVVDQAARLGVRISWRTHALVGIPITTLTLAIAAGWLWLRSAAH